MPIEDGVDFNGITITNHGKRTKHKTIEDALKSNDINILYPTILPNNISVTDIMLFEKDSKNKIIYFYSDPNLHSEISLNTQLSKAVKNGASEKTTINSIDCYICKMPDMQLVQIEFEFNGNYYMFTHTDKDILIEIIENLEEINNEN
ncbi:MAG: DUF4367 domain-containing protein [Acutalibacteraceae bacterium]|nr:DUF4367 domain-containing protein [Acutalibacteraceae bacterium]